MFFAYFAFSCGTGMLWMPNQLNDFQLLYQLQPTTTPSKFSLFLMVQLALPTIDPQRFDR